MEIRKLNTLRAIAALIVMVCHYTNDTHFLDEVFGGGSGIFGVMLFFMLSGFLMSYLYMRKDTTPAEIYRFAIARIARVTPLFLVIVLFSYAIQKLGIGVLYNIPNDASLISHLTLLSGTSVLWSIPPEIQFYFFFVFLWWFWKKWQEQLYIFLASLLVALIFLDFPSPKGDIYGVEFDIALFRTLPYFLTGVVFGQLYERWRVPNNFESGIYILAILLIPFLFPNVFYVLTGQHFSGLWKDMRILICISFVFFVVTFLVPDKNIFLSNRVGDFLGKISYSLYLLHRPVLWHINKKALEAPFLFFVVFLVITITVSYMSYILIERPSRNAIREFASKKLSMVKIKI